MRCSLTWWPICCNKPAVQPCIRIIAIALTIMAAPAYARDTVRLGLPEHSVELQASSILLGRRLFFDTRLSADGSISCATCHQPDKAFGDGRTVATGLKGRPGTRNTPSLINASLHATQFWDGRRATLEEQVLDPFINPAEHGLPDHGALISIVQRDKAYRDAFGQTVDLPGIAKALAQFIRSLASGNSAFDRYEYGGDAQALDEPAKRGLAIFRGRGQCAECHVIGKSDAPLTDNRFHNISVGASRIAPRLPALATRIARAPRQEIDRLVTSDADVAVLGRFVVTLDPHDIGRFRTPTLRNVALTAPYMHDGSIATLEEAIDHELYYRSQTVGRPLILKPSEKADLAAFLRSLNSAAAPRY